MRSGKWVGFMVVAVVFGCGLPAALAETLYVDGATGDDAWDGRCKIWDGGLCGPKATIQAGIDAAVAGDEVVIADGTYTGAGNKDLDFLGKAITLRSASGDPALCVIDCEGHGRGFEFHSGEGANSVVDGLTVTRGYVNSEFGGGGVCCSDGSPTLTNCTFSRNAASRGGGGVSCRSAATLTNCSITGNSAYWGGGVDCSYPTSPRLVNCRIDENSAILGGGVFCGYSYGRPTLENCIISANVAQRNGGAIHCDRGQPRLTNCTLRGNSAGGDGGGLFCSDASSPTVTNCILWNDTPQEISIDDPNSTLLMTYCDVQGGWMGAGNIDADPAFAFPRDAHLMPGSPCIDMGTNRPAGGLPAADADGNVRPLDGDGDSVATADIGAYECNPVAPSIALNTSAFVFAAPLGGADPPDQSLSLRNSGVGVLGWEITGQPAWLAVVPSAGESSGEVDDATLVVSTDGMPRGTYRARLQVVAPGAANAPCAVNVTLHVTGVRYVPAEYPTIQAAIDAAVDGDIVEVASGTYAGAGNKYLDFGGRAITLRSALGDPASCVIDCEGVGRGLYFHRGEGRDSVVEGLTITNGNAFPGAGVYCVATSPSFVRCVIRGNETTYGGGVYCEGGQPTFTQCTIRENRASRGAGLYCDESSPAIVHCEIDDNLYGSGVHCVGSHATLTDCAIRGNSSNWSGGGICCADGSGPTLAGCTISGNAAYGADEGGGIGCLDGSSPLLVECVIRENSAGHGGGIGCSNQSHPTVRRCTIQDNTASMGGGIACSYGSNPTVEHCAIRENSADVDGGGAYCNGSNPTFVACAITANTTTYGHGGGLYSEFAGSPVLTGCAIVRNSAYNGGGVECSDGGSWTFVNCSISGNTALTTFGGGGGLSCVGSSATLVNCTVVGNVAAERLGAAVRCSSSGSLILSNCILAGDSPQEILVGSSCTLEVTYCDVQGGWPGDGNIDADPLFVDPDGPDNDPNTWADNNYRLSPGSPCIDVGNNAAVPPGLLFDLDGQPRITDGSGDGVATVDMGAYERPATIIGDLNCDGVVNFGDINPFVDVLMDRVQYAAKYPGCDYTFADINGDGLVDFGDINPFIDLLMTQ